MILKQINCLIVDDQEIFRLILKKLITLDLSLKLVGECADAAEAHQMILKHHVDVLFLDIEMPGVNGFEFAQVLSGNGPLIIFITSRNDMAVEAFNLNVVDFMVKPISPSRFLKAIDKARLRLKAESPEKDHFDEEFVFIRESNVIKKLKLSDILYVESVDNYVKIHLQNHKHLIHSSLKSVEQKLSPVIFFRVHRSFIINLNKIDAIDSGMIIINNNLVPISDTYRAALNQRIQLL